MLLFDEMNDSNKLRIFNKFAYYPKLSKFKKTIYQIKQNLLRQNKNVKIKETDSLKNELNYFENVSKKNQKPITDGKFCLDILKLVT